jgi:uncharacterized protein
MKEAWVLRDAEVLCAAEIAESVTEKGKGLLGKRAYDGAMHFPRVRSVHTFMMRMPIDVAQLNADLTVVRTLRLDPWRMCLPRRKVRSVLEAEAGSFERWGLAVGDTLEIRLVA